MRGPTLSGILRSSAIAAVLVVLLGALALGGRPAAAQSPDDGCDTSEDVACLPLPDDSAPATAPGTAPAPRIAVAPIPCPPLLAPEPRIAAPVPPPPNCDRRAVIATVNRANVLYARSLRTLDAGILTEVWAGSAYAQIADYVAYLRSVGLYATPALRSIELDDLRVSGGRATVRTLENWLYQERARFSGRVTYEDNQWVANLYELEIRGGRWLVTRNEATLVPAPLPRPAPPLPPAPPQPCIAIFPPPPGCGFAPPLPPVTYVTVKADRPVYRAGETITATLTNIGTLTVSGGGGYRCGLTSLEFQAGDGGWYRAPGGSQICPAIAVLLTPQEVRSESFVAPFASGRYRLAVQVSSDYESDTFYSDEFSVLP